jgi:hypothetical protein
MQRYLKNHKCCATCAYWSGARQVTGNGSTKQVEVGSSNDHAKCFNNPNVGGFAYGPKAEYCCQNYQLFVGLQ